MPSGYSVIDALNSNSKAGMADKPKARFRTKDVSISNMYRNDMNFYGIRDIEKLASEILLLGMMENIVVVYDPCEKGEYRITSGERRWEALKMLVSQGHDEFKIATCNVRAKSTCEEERIELIVANSQRSKTIAEELEEERQLKETLETMRESKMKFHGESLDGGRIRDHVMKMLNLSSGRAAQMECINNNLIEEFKQEIRNETITFSAAYEISRMDQDMQKAAYKVFADDGELTHKQVKEMQERRKHEEEEKQQQLLDPEPRHVTSRCFSCKNYEKCPERSDTVQSCNEYVNADEPDSETEEHVTVTVTKTTETVINHDEPENLHESDSEKEDTPKQEDMEGAAGENKMDDSMKSVILHEKAFEAIVRGACRVQAFPEKLKVGEQVMIGNEKSGEMAYIMITFVIDGIKRDTGIIDIDMALVENKAVIAAFELMA